MNKFKKIAVSVVSIVMAGTMVGSLAACGETKKPGNSGDHDIDADGNITIDGLKLHVEGEEGSYKPSYSQGTELNVNIIDSSNKDRTIAYDAGQIATQWVGMDGVTYKAGDLKPAWAQLAKTLGVKFNNVAQADRSGKEISTAVAGGELKDYTLINGSVTEISGNMGSLVNLAKFLDYMPNFKAFLEEYQIVQWSLQMDDEGGMYYIPYFDGNDDIEKYELVQKPWVKALLDNAPSADKAISYLEQYKAKVNDKATEIPAADLAESFMGKTGSWSVDTTNPEDSTKTVKLVVNYDDVKAALATGALHDAVVAAGVATPQTASGNIVDIQNEIITATNGAVTGDKLLNVLQEYIKVAYKLDGKAYANLSDVFVSASAGWDADLMVAFFRCVVTNFKAFSGMEEAAAADVYALAGREAKPQRENDLIALAGELYGIRGMESRLNYLYIDAKGDLQDARLSEDSYEAAYRLNALAREGLMYNKVDTAAKGITKVYKPGSPITFMMHDYAQTQTTDGFKDAAFDFAPIVTPVSHWDVDGDGTAETTMRFTESWRSVKNGGVAIPRAAVENKPEVLAAVISFVDYLFSNDGQIVGSYGPMASGKTATDGFWYGTDGVDVLNADGTVKAEYASKVTTVDGEQYFLKKENRSEGFMYGNKLYKGLAYKDRQIPIMTDNNMNFYLGKEAGESGKMDTANQVGYKKNHQYKYTDYARGVVGAALPIGNKDQGFEYQCTAQCALDGAAIVSTALNNGSIKHVVQEVDSNNWWYTIVPSVLPVDEINATTIAGQKFIDGDSKTASLFNATGGTVVSNVYIDLAFWGYAKEVGEYYIGTCHKDNGTYAMRTNATELLEYVTTESNGGLVRRINWYKTAWSLLKTINL